MTAAAVAYGDRPGSATTVRRQPPPRWLLALVAAGGLGWAIALRVLAPHAPPYVGLSSHAWSVLLIWSGVIAWARRPEYRLGKLMVLAGASWLFKLLLFVPNAFAFTLSYVWQDFYDPILAYLALTFPTGRMTNRWGARLFWGYVLVMYVLWWPVNAMLTARHVAEPPYPGVHMHPVNLLSVHDLHVVPEIANYLGAPDWFGAYSGPAFFVVVLVIVGVRFARASRPAKRFLAIGLAPVVFTMTVIAVVYVLLSAVDPQDSKWFSEIAAVLYRVALYSFFALPAGFLFGLYLERRAQVRVSRLVVELDELPGLHGLEESLRRTLHDPSLRVALFDADGRSYRTADGEAFDIAEDASQMVVTRLERAGVPLGLIVHDRALLENPALLESTAAAVRMAVDNERLTAAVRAQLAEVQASRARIVEASDTERRKIERDLHDGAQQRLVSLAMSLRLATLRAEEAGDPALVEELARSSEALEHAITEVRDLARGIHPSVLTDEGLAAALAELAETSRVPVQLSVPPDRYPRPIEATAYFFVSEAVTNAAKHAQPSVVTVKVWHDGHHLHIEVADDGAGGADPKAGSGLRGLEDRVTALGGRMAIHSSPGHGTRLTAEIACASLSPTTRS